MRISDWSSDVCSSDLHGQLPGLVEGIAPSLAHHPVEHGVGMLPGMTFGVVGRGRQLALVVWRLPICLPLATGSMTRRAVLLIDLASGLRSEEHTSELQSLMRISYAVFCLKKKILTNNIDTTHKNQVQ